MIHSLILVRGIVGSGKSTVASAMSCGYPGSVVISADDFFMQLSDSGVMEYRFDPKLLSDAHHQSQARAAYAVENGRTAIVNNTFTQRWEMDWYINLAENTGARLIVVDCFDGGMSNDILAKKNVHGVPLSVIQSMRDRYEHDWRSGDPRPPWNRK